MVLLPLAAWSQDAQYPTINQGIDPASFSRVAMSGWQFLKLPTSARFMAMGGITTTLGKGDASSALANPAFVSDVENLSLSVNNMNWLVDTRYQSYAVVKNFGTLGAIGVHAIYLDYGDMPRTENQPIYEDDIYTGRTRVNTDLGSVTASDLAVGLTYSRRISDRLQVGGNMRYVRETLDDAKTSNWALDIGTIYYTGFRTLRFAMTGCNFGPDTEFAEYDERIGFPAVRVRMPMMFQLGAAFDLLEGEQANSPHLWTVAAEFVHPNDGPEKVHIGSEYAFMNFAVFRAGYRFNYDEEGLTLGTGLRLAMSTVKLHINYSFIDFGRFDNVQMFSLELGI